jgi:hypothetical protein
MPGTATAGRSEQDDRILHIPSIRQGWSPDDKKENVPFRCPFSPEGGLTLPSRPAGTVPNHTFCKNKHSEGKVKEGKFRLDAWHTNGKQAFERTA